MKISNVDIFVLKTPLEQPFAFSQGFVHQRAATLVRITTDNGLTGWGEAFCQGLEPPEIAAAAIEHALRPLLIGQPALDRQVLWHQMYHRTRDHGRKGSVMAAISGVDMALWDLAGHFYDTPVYQLLGGAMRPSVQPYATGFYRINGQGESERLATEAQTHYQNGFTAMKIKLGFGLQDDITVMHAIREALGTATVELMIDTNHAYGRSEARRLANALADCNLRWFEEPVVPEDIDGYRFLRQSVDTPIAGGENEHSPYGFHQLLGAQAVDIIQPDVGSCGGITALQGIAVMAQAAGVAVNPHVWGTSVAQAASLQVIVSLPTPHHSLFAQEPILEYDCSSHPFREDLVDTPLAMKEGRVAVSERSGLGITVNMETVERYQTNR